MATTSLTTLSTAAPAPTPAPTPAPAPAAIGTGMMFSTAPAPAPAATGTTTTPSPAPAPTVQVATPSNVNPLEDTVQGRIGQILTTDAKGNYTNPVVRQAVDRQNQTFNAKGMLNSSMAAQAGQEAAISKAVDIATPDAATYANTAEQQRQRTYEDSVRGDEQTFQLRKDYQASVQAVSTNFQKMVDTINGSDMSPQDKSVAIAQAQSVRDGELAYQNNLYTKMPNWQNEWLAMAVPTTGTDVNSISNSDTLSNIINDPAQSQATRDAARARLQVVGVQQKQGQDAAAAAAAVLNSQQPLNSIA